jgi:hypothetical protein
MKSNTAATLILAPFSRLTDVIRQPHPTSLQAAILSVYGGA